MLRKFVLGAVCALTLPLASSALATSDSDADVDGGFHKTVAASQAVMIKVPVNQNGEEDTNAAEMRVITDGDKAKPANFEAAWSRGLDVSNQPVLPQSISSDSDTSADSSTHGGGGGHGGGGWGHGGGGWGHGGRGGWGWNGWRGYGWNYNYYYSYRPYYYSYPSYYYYSAPYYYNNYYGGCGAAYPSCGCRYYYYPSGW